MITEQQARALAFLLNAIRPDWPQPSLVTLIGQHTEVPSLSALTIAAVTKARDHTCKTPAPIFTPGPHWPAEDRATIPRGPDCPDHVGETAATCRCCHADVKLGIRPPEYHGKHYDIPTT